DEDAEGRDGPGEVGQDEDGGRTDGQAEVVHDQLPGAPDDLADGQRPVLVDDPRVELIRAAGGRRPRGAPAAGAGPRRVGVSVGSRARARRRRGGRAWWERASRLDAGPGTL